MDDENVRIRCSTAAEDCGRVVGAADGGGRGAPAVDEALKIVLPLLLGYALKSVEELTRRRQASGQEWRTGQRDAIQALHLACVRLGANASLWYTDTVAANQVPPLPEPEVLRADQDLRLEIRSKQLLVDDHELVDIADRLLDAVADMLLPGDLPAIARFERMRELSEDLDARAESQLRALRSFSGLARPRAGGLRTARVFRKVRT